MSRLTKEHLEKLEALGREAVPGFKVRFKTDSRFQKLIGFLMFWNRGYMKEYKTTFWSTVWWTTREDYERNPSQSFWTLFHELWHSWDMKCHPVWFPFSYFMPQNIGVPLALISLLAIWFSLWWLMAIAFVVLLAPLPAYWRMKWEVRGYSAGLALSAWLAGGVSDELVDQVVHELSGSPYYWAWPFKRSLRSRLKRTITAIHNGDYFELASFVHKVHQIVMAEK